MTRATRTTPVSASTYRRRTAAPRAATKRAATTMEYLMILVFIVLPIGLMLPMFMNMVTVYALRLFSILALPYP